MSRRLFDQRGTDQLEQGRRMFCLVVRAFLVPLVAALRASNTSFLGFLQTFGFPRIAFSRNSLP